MHRIAFSMTIDPEGAMHDWVDLPAGFSLLRVPTQEAVHLLGRQGYEEVLLDLCAAERPAVLVTHPPYDHLTESGARRLRALGTQLIGYAFDDEIFAHHYGPDTRAALSRIYDRYVTPAEVPWATAPLPALLPAAQPAFDVVLVGRAYARRVELVDALRRAGLSVCARGHGWPEGFVSRQEMLLLYANAAVVLTTADWEHREICMVKHRLLDTAMLGVFQIAQAAPDLRRYFPADEVPAYGSAAELIGQVRAAVRAPEQRREAAGRARARALREHTWTRRFPDLLGPLTLPPQPPPAGPARLYDQLLLALATRAEADGRIAAAAALYRERLARDPDEPAACAGLGRCLRDLGDPEGALPWLRRAAAAEAPPCAAALHATLPPCGVGCGLGRLGLLPPAAEPIIHEVAALCDLDRLAEAVQVLDRVEAPALRRAIAATLRVDVDGPEDPSAELAARLAVWRQEL